MANPETTDAARAAVASAETSAQDTARTREDETRRQAELAEAATRREVEDRERAAREEAAMATEHRRAQRASARRETSQEAVKLEAVEGVGIGKAVKVRIRNKDGALVYIEQVFGIPNPVQMVYGRKVGLDVQTGAVTVPEHLRPADLPLLARELIRATKGGQGGFSEETTEAMGRRAPDDRAVKIEKEIKTRREFEEGLAEMRDTYRFFDFSATRDRYKRLEEAHAETVQNAEKAIDDLLPGLVSEYTHVTGRDVYEEAGGEEAVKKKVRQELLAQHAGLVFKYDKKGNRHFFGTPEEGVEDLRGLSLFDQAARLWCSSETVQDYRMHRKMLRRLEDEEEHLEKIKLTASKAARWPGQVLVTFGKTGLMMTLAAGALVIDQPRKILTWGLDKVDGWFTGMYNGVGKWWLGKEFTPSISAREKRKKTKEGIKKSTDEKLRAA